MRWKLYLNIPGSTGLCGYVQPSHGCSNEGVLEPVEKWNRATELRDICKYLVFEQLGIEAKNVTTITVHLSFAIIGCGVELGKTS